MYLYTFQAVIFWQRGRTDRLHLRQLLLVFDDGAVEFLLLRSQLQLQLPVLLLLPVNLGVDASVASPHRLPSVHHLRQLVDSLKAKKHNILELYRDLFKINMNLVYTQGSLREYQCCSETDFYTYAQSATQACSRILFLTTNDET